MPVVEHSNMVTSETADIRSILSPHMPDLDDIVAVAAEICGTATSAISLIQNGRVSVLSSNTGLDAETSAQDSFCSRTILQDQLLEVTDARLDPRFAKNVFVDTEGGIRFYAGVPFSRADGSRMGALCVFDQQPRALTALQRKTLIVLARQITARLRDVEQRLLLDQAMRETEAARSEMQARQHRFDAFINGGPFVAFMKDADGRMLYINRAFKNAIQSKVPEMLGKTDDELWEPEKAARFRKVDTEVLATGQPQIGDEVGVGSDGTRIYWRFYKFPISDGAGKVYLGGLAIDTTKDRQREEEFQRMQEELQLANDLLQRLAMTDPLTGVHNRRAFDQRLEEESATAVRHKRPLTMLLLDVDHFKRHNDLFGHAAGDSVLRDFAHVLRTVSRREDVLGRLGGEEFAVIMPNSDENAGQRLASRVLRAVHAFPWQHAAVTVSAGVAELMPSQTPADLLEAADQAMYAAKREGRDRTMRASDIKAVAAK